MKSLTKSIRAKSIKPKFVARDVRAQFSLPVAGVLQEVQSAFFGLCVNAGKAVLGAMTDGREDCDRHQRNDVPSPLIVASDKSVLSNDLGEPLPARCGVVNRQQPDAQHEQRHRRGGQAERAITTDEIEYRARRTNYMAIG